MAKLSLHESDIVDLKFHKLECWLEVKHAHEKLENVTLALRELAHLMRSAPTPTLAPGTGIRLPHIDVQTRIALIRDDGEEAKRAVTKGLQKLYPKTNND